MKVIIVGHLPRKISSLQNNFLYTHFTHSLGFVLSHFFLYFTTVNKNTLGAKKWCGQEKQQLKGVI